MPSWCHADGRASPSPTSRALAAAAIDPVRVLVEAHPALVKVLAAAGAEFEFVGPGDILEYPLHPLPLFVTPCVCGAALELRHVCLPFRLAGELGEAGHITFPVEAVDGVADHEQGAAAAIDLHVQNPHLTLAFNDLGPDVLVGLHILLDHWLVVDERQRLAIAFHDCLALIP